MNKKKKILRRGPRFKLNKPKKKVIVASEDTVCRTLVFSAKKYADMLKVFETSPELRERYEHSKDLIPAMAYEGVMKYKALNKKE